MDCDVWSGKLEIFLRICDFEKLWFFFNSLDLKLIDWLNDWLIDWLINQLIGWWVYSNTYFMDCYVWSAALENFQEISDFEKFCCEQYFICFNIDKQRTIAIYPSWVYHNPRWVFAGSKQVYAYIYIHNIYIYILDISLMLEL